MAEPEIYEYAGNPLDNVEEVLSAHRWAFNRTGQDELFVDVSGRFGNYRILFIWQDQYESMQMSCYYDFAVHDENLVRLPDTLMALNNQSWLGHFDMDPKGNYPCFRYNCLFKGQTSLNASEQIEELVEIALSECERQSAVFQVLAQPHHANDAHVKLALMSVDGEC